MSFTEAIGSVFSNYANFSGRARRSEYWYFTLLNILVAGLGSGLTVATDGKLSFVSAIWSLAVLIPGLAVTVRRLHDVGKSGWYMFMALIPLVGGIILLVAEATDSQPGYNQYGPNPKGIGNNNQQMMY